MLLKVNFEHIDACGTIPMINAKDLRSWPRARFDSLDDQRMGTEAALDVLESTRHLSRIYWTSIMAAELSGLGDKIDKNTTGRCRLFFGWAAVVERQPAVACLVVECLAPFSCTVAVFRF